MRLVKTLLLALLVVIALTAGLVVTVVVAVIGAAIYFGRRLLSPAPKRPTMTTGSDTRPAPAANGEVIDVTATEIR